MLAAYHDPAASGSVGGVQRFAEGQGISVQKARSYLEKDLGYTLHKPRTKTFQDASGITEVIVTS